MRENPWSATSSMRTSTGRVLRDYSFLSPPKEHRHDSTEFFFGGYLAAMTMVASVLATSMPLHAQSEPFTFSFPGGTLKDYVDLVKEKSPNIQILLAPEIEGLKVGAAEFKRVSASALLQMVPQLVHGHVELQTSGLGGGGFAGHDNVIWQISPPPYITQVFSVLNVLTGKPVEDAMKSLVSAIEATSAIGSNSTPEVKIKLHADTGLLLVAGTQEQIRIVQQVVSQLPGAEEATDNTVQELLAQVAQLQQEVILTRVSPNAAAIGPGRRRGRHYVEGRRLGGSVAS